MNSIKNTLKITGLVLAGTIAVASQAQAQVTQDIPFGGTVTGTCTFGTLTAGTLARAGTLNAVEGSTGVTGGGAGAAGRTTITCTSGGSLSVAAPNPVAVPAGWNPPVRNAIVQLGTTANYTQGSFGGNFDGGLWSQPTAPLTIPGGAAQTLNVGMIAGTNAPGTPLTGTYGYSVRLTATPN